MATKVPQFFFPLSTFLFCFSYIQLTKSGPRCICRPSFFQWLRTAVSIGASSVNASPLFYLMTETVLDFETLSKSFIYQQMHFISFLENIKIYMKTYIKISPTCFDLRQSPGSLHMILAKVTFIKSVKVRRYGRCSMLPHNRIVHNDVLLPI